MRKILSRGAEAIIYLDLDKRVIIKERIWKKYRIKEINEKIIKNRTKLEVKILNKCSEIGINVPKILEYDIEKGIIIMEYLDGILLRDFLDKLEGEKKYEKIKEIFEKIGEYLAKMHNNNIIHNDLTTSNIIVKNDKIYFIDFGLSFFSSRVEDKAVDSHLIKESLKSRHSKIEDICFKSLINSYKKISKDGNLILKRLERIEKRGRYIER